MANVPQDLKYTKDHEWARIEGNVATVGITDYAQHELGDIVYVELPETGTELAQEAQFGEIEAVKTVASLNAPVSGKIVEVNQALADNAEPINKDPYGNGWLIKIELANPAEPDTLLGAAQYEELI